MTKTHATYFLQIKTTPARRLEYSYIYDFLDGMSYTQAEWLKYVFFRLDALV